jgi:hypothetical protein
MPIIQDGQPIWKVLVFDNLGRDVISSVMRVNDLRSCGITIHLNLNTTRHTIPDVPVIYLIEPTKEVRGSPDAVTVVRVVVLTVLESPNYNLRSFALALQSGIYQLPSDHPFLDSAVDSNKIK